ncbi:uncharacterized protein LOC128231443 [Mya arenaria]|uniref:uncharacterized protein LOC128231443 n=1 Tax=Mya arenaria TaxID=6604 RepID=UPI0022E54A36|nr:uncharacterized protein LOC128231443 [Mya arenaria]
MEKQDDVEKLTGIIFTALSTEHVPLSLDEICLRNKHLRKRRTATQNVLNTFVNNDICMIINQKYILIENAEKSEHTYQTQLSNQLSSLEVDGDLTSSFSEGTNHSRELPRVEARGGQATGPRHQRAMEKCSMDMAVAVRSNSTVQRHISEKSLVPCDSPEVRQYIDILQSINDFMMKQSLPLKAKDIAQGTKLGQSRTSVNRYLYCLEKKGILTVNDKREWTFSRAITGDEMEVCAAQLAKKPSSSSSSTSTLSSSLPSSTSTAGGPGARCPCPNAGPRCTHNHYEVHQHIHKHEHHIQVGDNNAMYTNSPHEGQPNYRLQ